MSNDGASQAALRFFTSTIREGEEYDEMSEGWEEVNFRMQQRSAVMRRIMGEDAWEKQRAERYARSAAAGVRNRKACKA